MSWVTSRRFRASLLPVCTSLAPLHRGAALHMLLGTTCFAEVMRLGRSQNSPGRSFVGCQSVHCIAEIINEHSLESHHVELQQGVLHCWKNSSLRVQRVPPPSGIGTWP